MAEYDDLLTQARAVGDQILRQPRFRAYVDALKKLDADATARGLLSEYHHTMDQLQQKQFDGKPIEVAEKRALESIESRVAANPVIKEYMQTQADYVELMEKIRGAMESPLAAAVGQSEARP